MKKKIGVIGLGNIGKRHLQSLLNGQNGWQIYGIDPDQECLRAIRENSQDFKLRDAVLETDISVLPEHIDVAVIATSSAVRREVFEQLIAHSQIDFIIFEKVLFQRAADFYYVEECLKAKKIHAWVNCSRRECPSFQKLKEQVDLCKTFEMHTRGGCWGLACNTIHILDLVEWYAGEAVLCIASMNLSDRIEESKRKGYVEVFGSILGTCGRCENWSISCFADSSLPLETEIIGDQMWCRIDYGRQQMKFACAASGWQEEKYEFKIPFQSELTQKVVGQILDTGTCNLTEYQDSMRLHLAFMELMMDFFEKKGMEKKICPIT